MKHVFLDTNILIDYVQYQCAKVAGCDVIVTGNKRHYTEFSDLPLMTANEILTELEPL